MWSCRSLISIAGVALAVPLAAGAASAQTCGADYTVQEGDSLATIATHAYGKSTQWSVIFYANQDRMGSGNALLVPGLAIRIPCLDGNQAKLPDAAAAEAPAK